MYVRFIILLVITGILNELFYLTDLSNHFTRLISIFIGAYISYMTTVEYIEDEDYNTA